MPQFYDRYGNLVEGDINEHITASQARWQAEVQQRQSAAWRRKALRTAAAGAAMFGGAAALSAMAPATASVAPSVASGGVGATAATGTAAGTTAAAGAGMTAGTKIAIGEIIANTLGSLWGAHAQSSAMNRATDAQTRAANRAAELEYQAITDALNYQKQIDARDYGDWLNREARDRRDWEISEQRRAPYRALGDSAVRTLADYIRVPGMRPAQEIAPQIWTDPHAGMPRNSTMPVGGSIRDLAGGSQPGMFVSPPRPGQRTLRDLTMYA